MYSVPRHYFEGGHAAHFANIKQGSPVFSQERAPFSVALAETQSMFLDSLCDDAAWLARYAKDRKVGSFVYYNSFVHANDPRCKTSQVYLVHHAVTVALVCVEL